MDMKSVLHTIVGAASCATLFVATTANAHYLWIESGDTGAKLYYGEPDVLLKEKSPGKLDNIKAPLAFVPDVVNGKATAIGISRSPEYFIIASGKTAPIVLASEESLEVRDLTKHGLGFAKSNYYARHGQADARNSPLALDLQSRGPNTYTVLYRGQPLQNAKLEVIAPNTWMQEHTTDAQGTVQINAPWRGQYVVHVLHIDKTPGEFDGKKYDSLRNHFTYTFVKAEGADPGPAAPPKHPME